MWFRIQVYLQPGIQAGDRGYTIPIPEEYLNAVEMSVKSGFEATGNGFAYCFVVLISKIISTMKKIYSYLIGSNFPNQFNHNLSFAILRFFVGLALCTVFEKFFPKNGIWGPQEWFIQDVGDMGFPLPVLFAWIAVLTEFFGGILLMFGFLTRPAAILNAMVTFVAAFVYHHGDIVKPGLLAFFFMIMCISIALNGPGKYSIDYLIHQRKTM